MVNGSKCTRFVCLPFFFEAFKFSPSLDSLLMGHRLRTETEIEQACAPNKYAVRPDKVTCCIVKHDIRFIWTYGETTGVLVETCTPDFLSKGDQTCGVA